MNRVVKFLIVILVLGMMGFAQGDKPLPPFPKKLIAELGLSAAQEKQIKDQRKDQEQKMLAKFKELKALHEGLDKEFLKDSPDEQKIITLIASLKAKQVELADIHFAGLLELRQILTKEQFKKFVQLQQKMRGRMEKRFAEHKKEHRPPKTDNGGSRDMRVGEDDDPPPPPRGEMMF